MPRDMLIHSGVAETCVAIVNDGELIRYWQEQTIGARDAGRVGDVVLGRVSRVLPSMEAAFVDIGAARAGFLSARDAGPRERDAAATPARAFAREGETVLVQVVKEAVADKGARLSAKIAIPGRYLVLVAEGSGVAVSRRIEDEAERKRLTALVEGMARRSGAVCPDAGYIVRTAAIGAAAAAIEEDAARLQQTWRGIVASRQNAQAPSTLYREPGLIERALRDEADTNIRAVLIDDALAADPARAYAAGAAPILAPRIETYRGHAPLFEAFGIEDAIAALGSARVDLPSGGWITIESTEAMTTIDVNSGRHADGGTLEDVSLAVNLEASEAIARQLALRELGGLIVVDFIYLSQAKDSARLMEALGAALARDRTPAEVSPVSEFGLVAITRKRERDPVSVRQSEPCACCQGSGRRKTAASVALEVLRRAERAAALVPGKPIVAFAAPDVVEWLHAHEHDIAPALARRGAPHWRAVAQENRTRENFAVETQT